MVPHSLDLGYVMNTGNLLYFGEVGASHESLIKNGFLANTLYLWLALLRGVEDDRTEESSSNLFFLLY